ncbi:MAG: radical SAM protein [Helicobacteraceae bacterium]|jgi:DNA repair photolyase|nr:radical SAM protein [Helicobacteraceae bacterium]
MEYVSAKTIVTQVKDHSWFGIDYNMNIYRGCSHGCIYCDSRSLCYKIENFDQIRSKKDALRIIRNDLLKKRKRGVVATGSMSDPYNPLEKELKLTRNALELLNAYRFGVAIATKSQLVVRDINILKDIQVHSPVIVKITITTHNDNLCKIIEPNAPLSNERFSAVKELTDSGVYAGILMTPLLPYIEDTEENIINIVHKAKENGARFIYPAIGMTLRSGNREYYYEKLDKYFPGIKEKYIKKYGERYKCTSPHINKLWNIFTNECERARLRYEMRDIIIDYKRGYAAKQLSLF